MKSILLFVLFVVHLAAAFHCPPNVTQNLIDSDNQTYRFDVAIQNASPYFLREILLVPSGNMTVQGMNVSESGVGFHHGFHGLPPYKTYHWRYTQDSAEPATFEVVVSECVNKTRNHHNHHGGNHTHSGNDTRPTVGPTADPVPSAAPTEGPSSAPTSAATSAPTSNPTSGPTSDPTSAPTSSASAPSSPTSAPTSAATSSRATSAPTSAPTSSATSAPTSSATSAPTSSATSAPTSSATSAPTSSATSAPTSSATSAPTSAATSAPTTAPNTTTISGTCSGSPRTLNGKPCASTTRYWDGNLGACGCGTSSGSFSWVADTYTAAASPPLFGTATDCGTGCGKCYQLTATGYSPSGTGATAGQTITVMITNLCPAGGDWCASGINSFDYGAHFDLADSPTGQLITKLGWDNPEVVYEEVSCSGVMTPTASDSSQCTCPTA